MAFPTQDEIVVRIREIDAALCAAADWLENPGA